MSHMYSRQYAEALEDDQAEARNRERAALDHSIMLMERAHASHGTAVDTTKAVYFTSKLWAVLVEDLADPNNALPQDLKAQIISIGIWILKELERIREGNVVDFEDLIIVSRSIRDGLP